MIVIHWNKWGVVGCEQTRNLYTHLYIYCVSKILKMCSWSLKYKHIWEIRESNGLKISSLYKLFHVNANTVFKYPAAVLHCLVVCSTAIRSAFWSVFNEHEQWGNVLSHKFFSLIWKGKHWWTRHELYNEGKRNIIINRKDEKKIICMFITFLHVFTAL